MQSCLNGKPFFFLFFSSVSSVLYHSCNNMTLKKRNKSVVQLSDGTFCEIMTLVAFKCEDGASSASTTNRFCVLAKERAWRIFFFF